MSGETTEQVVVPPPSGTKTESAPAQTTDTLKEEDASAKPPRMTTLARLEEAVESSYLPVPYKANLALLKELQVEHLNIEEEYRREWNAMKVRYLAKFQPLYEKRFEILQTAPANAPAPEAPAASPPADAAPDATPAPPAAGAASQGTPGLPDFWLEAMKNNLLLEEMIEEHDIPILRCLENIVFDWINPMEQTSFRLDFHFGPNEYFSNKVLSKAYHLERSEDDDDESVLVRTVGTEINWFPNKNVTQRLVARRQRNKRTNQTRTVTQAVDENSFFNYFQSHEIPSEEQLETMDDVSVNELEMIVEAEFEVGSVIRDKIIPRAVGWFLHIERDDEASDASGDDMRQGFDDDDDDDDDDE